MDILLALTLALSPCLASWQWPLAPPIRILRAFSPPPLPWSPGHRGIDLAALPGQPVYAAGPGQVTYAAHLAGRGVIAITHPTTLRTTYLPVTPSVHLGQTVHAGQRIGTLEPTPAHCAPATCLHWGLLRADHYLNPLLLLCHPPIRLLPLWPGSPTKPQPTAIPPTSTQPTNAQPIAAQPTPAHPPPPPTGAARPRAAQADGTQPRATQPSGNQPSSTPSSAPLECPLPRSPCTPAPTPQLPSLVTLPSRQPPLPPPPRSSPPTKNGRDGPSPAIALVDASDATGGAVLGVLLALISALAWGQLRHRRTRRLPPGVIDLAGERARRRSPPGRPTDHSPA